MTLLLAGLYIAGAVFSNWRAGENFFLSTLTGTKLGAPSEGIDKTGRGVALLIIAAVSGFWVSQ